MRIVDEKDSSQPTPAVEAPARGCRSQSSCSRREVLPPQKPQSGANPPGWSHTPSCCHAERGRPDCRLAR